MDEKDRQRQFRTVERRRMIQVKDALAAGLERLESNPAAARFVAACIDYLGFIVGRFLQQGCANVERLREAVPATDPENLAVLGDIDSSLTACRQELQRLTAARADDPAALAAAARRFVDFYNQTLASRKDPAQAIIRQYFDPDTYWRQTNDVTAEVIDREAMLFERLLDLAPGGLHLETRV